MNKEKINFMEYHSFIDSEGKFIGKTKYISGELIPIPPEEVIEDIRYINHKWRCILPKVKQERAYIGFNLNINDCSKIDNTLLQLEVYCKKNEILPELRIKYKKFNQKTIEQQKEIIKSMIEHNFNDVIFVDDSLTRTKCRSFFTYNYNTKRREYNKIYFRKNVNYSFDCETNITASKGVDCKLLSGCLDKIKKIHDNFYIEVNLSADYIGCNAKCWYCCQGLNFRKIDLEKTTNDKNIVPTFKKIINKVIELAKKENVKIQFNFLGGELTILNNEIQEEIIKIIDELIENGYKVLIFSNGIIKDAPLLHTKANYLIHETNWKNKVLEKKKNVIYMIIFTEKDSIEDLKKFKKLNKDESIYDIQLNNNATSEFYKKFYKKEANPTHKERDKKHKIYLCRYNYKRAIGICFPTSSEHFIYRACCSAREVSNDEINTLNTTEMKCPKICTSAYNKK